DERITRLERRIERPAESGDQRALQAASAVRAPFEHRIDLGRCRGPGGSCVHRYSHSPCEAAPHGAVFDAARDEDGVEHERRFRGYERLNTLANERITFCGRIE